MRMLHRITRGWDLYAGAISEQFFVIIPSIFGLDFDLIAVIMSCPITVPHFIHITPPVAKFTPIFKTAAVIIFPVSYMVM